MKQLGVILQIFIWSFILATAQAAESTDAKHTFAIGTNDFLLDGRRFQIRCGEIHAPRVPREYWRQRLQMAKAMGLNTVCAYLFWNMHEPRPGEFNWSGQADAAEFCRIAQEEGLWVILRPGPYACAEWEMGGLPWWLLKYDDIKLRTRDPRYLNSAKSYLKEVGRVLGPLQISSGGPILMVQVENEYGSYGKDAEYMGELRQCMLDAGFNVPLFACNPANDLKNGYRKDLFPVVNFGADPANGFKALREILPQGPLMCGEFYPGWFDTWGSPHHLGKTDQYLKDLEYMLKSGASFSVYMAHGGTSFGFWSGADRPFKPDTSSYDYDAPISEAGWTTGKFFKTRELLAKYLLPGENIPNPPSTNAVIAIPETEVKEFALLWSASNMNAVADSEFRNMEAYDQDFGCILYATALPAGPEATLEFKSVHDIGQVFLDHKRMGFLDRRSGNFRVRIPERSKESSLWVLVEAMGRVNFGVEVHDRKGLVGPAELIAGDSTRTKVTNRWVYNLSLDEKFLRRVEFSENSSGTNLAAIRTIPGFYRAKVNINDPGDTFLDMRSWGKGLTWVNGHNVGRYWNIGPQQTMYIPGSWLKKGTNEIIILDLLGTERPVVVGLNHPILNELHPEKDFARSRRPQSKLHLEGATPVYVGEFADGAAVQEVKFAGAANGRYFCLETLDAKDGQPYAAIAELDLLDANGNRLSHENWKVAYVDSEERAKEDGTAENAIDGQTANYWHTEWSDKKPGHPHCLVLDLGQSREISGFRYVPRQGPGGGRINGYRIYASEKIAE